MRRDRIQSIVLLLFIPCWVLLSFKVNCDSYNEETYRNLNNIYKNMQKSGIGDFWHLFK